MTTGPMPWLVGECNPYSRQTKFDLYPLPPESAGGRLCSLILGMNRGTYMRSFMRINLCCGRWTITAARATVRDLLPAAAGAPLILLGAKVCAAVGVGFNPWTAQSFVSGGKYAVLPHPSGLSRLWNEPRAFERAREVVLEVAPHLAGFVGSRERARGEA